MFLQVSPWFSSLPTTRFSWPSQQSILGEHERQISETILTWLSVVGGVFNATLQLGAVAGLAINATIQSFFPDHAAEATGEHRIAWKGYQSNFIFMASL
jgi:hypothetical protein